MFKKQPHKLRKVPDRPEEPSKTEKYSFSSPFFKIEGQNPGRQTRFLIVLYIVAILAIFISICIFMPSLIVAFAAKISLSSVALKMNSLLKFFKGK